MYIGHVFGNRLENTQQPVGRQHHGVPVSQKDSLHYHLLAAPANLLQHLLLVPGAKLLLLGGVHVAEGALVPGTAIGDRQNQ